MIKKRDPNKRSLFYLDERVILLVVVRENDLGFYNDQGIFTIPAKQYDTGRIFKFNIIDICDIDLTDCEVYIRIAKPDGTQFQGHECTQILDNSTILVDTSIGNGNQILTAPGCNRCELNIKDQNGKILTTWSFNINVESRVHDGSNIMSLDSFDFIDNIINEEQKRIENEKIRENNESDRIINENQRIIDENLRKQTFGVVLNDAKKYADNAASSADSAKTSEESSKNYSDLSMSYAIGSNNEIRENDSVDNAKSYCEQSEKNSEASKRYLNEIKNASDTAMDIFNNGINGDNYALNMKVNLETGHLLYESVKLNFQVNNGHLEWGIK